jgi:hypothetical protein
MTGALLCVVSDGKVFMLIPEPWNYIQPVFG